MGNFKYLKTYSNSCFACNNDDVIIYFDGPCHIGMIGGITNMPIISTKRDVAVVDNPIQLTPN